MERKYKHLEIKVKSTPFIGRGKGVLSWLGFGKKPKAEEAPKQNMQGKPCPPGYNAERDGCIPAKGDEATPKPAKMSAEDAIAARMAEARAIDEKVRKQHERNYGTATPKPTVESGLPKIPKEDLGKLDVSKIQEVSKPSVEDVIKPKESKPSKDTVRKIDFTKTTIASSDDVRDDEKINAAYYDELSNRHSGIKVDANGRIKATAKQKLDIKNKLYDDLSSAMTVSDDKIREFNDFLKSNKLGTLSMKSGETSKKPALVRSFISRWSETSGDSDVLAQAMQYRCASLFGIEDFYDADPGGKISKRAKEVLDKFGDIFDDYLKSSYDITQKTFKEMGMKEMVLYRGMGSSDQPNSMKVTDEDMVLQPMSSYAHDYTTAISFSSEENDTAMDNWESGKLIAMRVPVERIFSTAVTGAGCLEESEVIVLGGKCKGKVISLKGDEDNNDIKRVLSGGVAADRPEKPAKKPKPKTAKDKVGKSKEMMSEHPFNGKTKQDIIDKVVEGNFIGPQATSNDPFGYLKRKPSPKLEDAVLNAVKNHPKQGYSKPTIPEIVEIVRKNNPDSSLMDIQTAMISQQQKGKLGMSAYTGNPYSYDDDIMQAIPFGKEFKYYINAV